MSCSFTLVFSSHGESRTIYQPHELEQALHDMSFGNMNSMEIEIKKQLQAFQDLREELISDGESRRIPVDDMMFLLRLYDLQVAKDTAVRFLGTLQNYRFHIEAPRDNLSVSIHLNVRLDNAAGGFEDKPIVILDEDELRQYLAVITPDERELTTVFIHNILKEHAHIQKICENPRAYHARDLPLLHESTLEELQAFAQRLSLLPPRLWAVAASENTEAARKYTRMYNIAAETSGARRRPSV